MAAVLPHDMRAISLDVSPETGAGGFILPNDHVDVLLTHRDKAAEKTTGFEKYVTETILKNVRVLAIDQVLGEKDGQKVALGKTQARSSLTPRQTEVLALSRQLGTISPRLRSLIDLRNRRFPKRGAEENDEKRRQGARHEHCALWQVNVVKLNASPTGNAVDFTMATGTSIRAAALAVLIVVSWTVSPGAAVAGGASNGDAVLWRFCAIGLPRAISIRARTVLRRRQIGRHRSSARHQGRARCRSQDRQCRIRSALRYIIGGEVGQTNVFFFDAEGRQMAGFDIAVTRNLNGIRVAIKQPATWTSDGHRRRRHSERHRVEPGRGAAGLRHRGAAGRRWLHRDGRDWQQDRQRYRGPRSRPDHAQGDRRRGQAHDRAVPGTDLPALGFGSAVVNLTNTNPFSASGQSLSGSSLSVVGSNSLTATLQAMEQAGVIHTLAEPNLTAISGEKATFYAGGEFPVLNGFSCTSGSTPGAPSTCQPSIDFKKFGVAQLHADRARSQGCIEASVVSIDVRIFRPRIL